MNLQYFFKQRLDLIVYVLHDAASPFIETMRKINCGQEPYIDTSNPEFSEEPQFLDDYFQAQAAVDIVRAACLDQLQTALHCFLKELLHEVGPRSWDKKIASKGSRSWLRKYQAFFEVDLQIDWGKSGVDLDLLEKVVLARNDFIHNVDLLSLGSRQTKAHADKYPESEFVDPMMRKLIRNNPPLVMPEATILQAIEECRRLVAYLEPEAYSRCASIRRLKRN